MIRQPVSLPSVTTETENTAMASTTENAPSEHLETEEKQPADLQETKRKEVFFTQTEVLLSVDTKLELQNKLKR